MKNSWQLKQFENCITSVEYTRKIQRKDFLDDGQFPIVSQEAAFINGYWDNEADVFRVSTPVIIFGDHTKVLKYVDFDFVLGADGVKILKPREFFYPKFFFYHLCAANMPSMGYARHYRILKELHFFIPPLSEQRRIVAILDEAFAGIAAAKEKAEQNLKNAKEVFTHYLKQVFNTKKNGWVENNIGEICLLKSGTTMPHDLEKETGDIPYLKVADMNFEENIGCITMSSRFLDKKDIKDSIIIPKGAVIFPKRGGAILTNKKRMTSIPICADLNIMAVIPTCKIESKLLYYYFLDVDMKKIGTGSSIPQINNYDISPLSIVYPRDLFKQKEIVSFLDEISEETGTLESIYQQKLANLEKLKKSLLQQAFSGAL